MPPAIANHLAEEKVNETIVKVDVVVAENISNACNEVTVVSPRVVEVIDTNAVEMVIVETAVDVIDIASFDKSQDQNTFITPMKPQSEIKKLEVEIVDIGVVTKSPMDIAEGVQSTMKPAPKRPLQTESTITVASAKKAKVNTIPVQKTTLFSFFKKPVEPIPTELLSPQENN